MAGCTSQSPPPPEPSQSSEQVALRVTTAPGGARQLTSAERTELEAAIGGVLSDYVASAFLGDSGDLRENLARIAWLVVPSVADWCAIDVIGDGQTVERVAMAHADPELLRVILTNLIGNAIKFTRGRAEPSIEITTRPLLREVEVSVRDNGAGFDPEQSMRLFQPFRRLHGNAFEGSGVGLSIVQRAVQRHGGHVSAESAGQDRGACFRFTLPAAPAP